MSASKLDQFGGMLPAWDDRLLPAGQAAFALNAYLFSGALTGWRAPKLLRNLLNASAAMVYRIPTNVQGTAFAYLAFIAQPVEGDAVKLGEETYKFTATVTSPYDVLIGANSTVSAANLFQAFTLTGTIGTTYGTGTCVNPAVSAVAGVNSQITNNFGAGSVPVLFMKAPDFGAAFNTTAVTTAAPARLLWVFDLNLAHTTVTFQGGTNQTFDSGITGSATWLEFVDPDTQVMRSPTVDDKFGRYYFASPSLPPEYNSTPRIQAGLPSWLLGVPPPGCALGVQVAGGGDLAQMGFPNTSSVNTVFAVAQTMYLTQITPAGAMALNDISFMPSATNATVKFAAVLYADNAGIPGTLLNTGVVQQGVVASSQATSQFINPTGLLINTPYWIGIMVDSNVAVFKADDTGTAFAAATTTFTNGPPGVAPNMTFGQGDLQLWGNLTTSSVLASRAYLYTWVTEYGEEGPASPPTLVNGWSNAIWTLSFFTPPPDDMGVVRNIKTLRLYRTVSGTTGQTTYFWVCDIDLASNTVIQSNNIQGTGDGSGSVVTAGTGIVVDTMDDSVIALNTQIPSTLWFPPPEGLQGMLSMPNGIAVGFKGNELWFSEPYFPHAWPPNYVLTTEFPIVGIGVHGQSVVACTSGTPYIATGVAPSSMSLTKTAMAEPCISRGSIISTDNGVFYASLNGLILVTQMGSVSNTTELWITREKWRKLTPPKNVRAIMLASSYFAFGSVNGADHSVAQQGFTIELSVDSASFTIWPQPGGHRLGFGSLSAPGALDIVNVQVDPWTGTGLLIQNGGVYYYDFADQAPTVQTYTWRSKKFQQTAKTNFEVVKVYFSIPPNTPAQAAVRNETATLDPSWNTLGAGQYGILRVFADDVLVTTREIRTSAELLRVLSGFKADTWQYEITARVEISNFQIGTSVKDIGSV